jgi:enoyl-[acyl-carrier protein] reductase III
LNLARRGASIVIAYLRNREAAEQTASAIEDLRSAAIAVRTHVGEEDDIENLFEQVGSIFGRLDIFVSNAATGVIRPVAELDSKAWAWTMDSNARSFLLGARRAFPLMTEGGSMVAMSSQGANRVLPGYSVVGASKAALEALVRYLAVELAPTVRVNAVSPGVVDTDALKHFPMREEMLTRAREETPAGRIVTPEDVAGLVDYLTSDTAVMITGQTLVIDGGAGLLA